MIEEILPYLDQYLLDIKHMNSKKHEEFTGRGNELMLENAKKNCRFRDDRAQYPDSGHSGIQ